ncbi:MAG: DUF2953 domain-containing protein [bacterium]
MAVRLKVYIVGSWQEKGWAKIVRQLAISLILFLALLLLTPIKIALTYYYKQGKNLAILNVSILFGLVKINWDSREKRIRFIFIHSRISFSWQFPSTRRRLRKEAKTFSIIRVRLESWRGKRGLINRFYPYFFGFIKGISLKKFVLEMKIGTGDAAETGILVGSIYGCLGLINHFLFRYLKQITDKLKIIIKPDFNHLYLDVYFTSIIEMLPGYIIIEMLKFLAALIWYLYIIKGGRVNERASYSGFNEDCYGKYQGNG